MASNTFLPFITEKSSPVNLYDTLISRSKGLDRFTILHVFYIILMKGIKTIRKQVTEMSNASSSEIFQKIIASYPSVQINKNDYNVFLSMRNIISNYNVEMFNEKLKEFSIEDTLSFMLIMCLMDKRKDYSTHSFEILLDHKIILSNLPNYINLSDDGVKCVFINENSLKEFILFTVALTPAEANNNKYCMSINSFSEKNPDFNYEAPYHEKWSEDESKYGEKGVMPEDNTPFDTDNGD